MPSRKYNEFLDADHSEDDDSSNRDSDDVQETKGRTTGPSQASKRENIRHEPSDNESDQEVEPPLGLSLQDRPNATIVPLKSTSIKEVLPPSKSTEHPPIKPTHSKPPKTTSSRPRKPGVVYLSRIPPFMRPSTVRHILSPFGTITRLFLTPEPPSQHTSRVRSGGNKKRSFIDGWIEFSSHKHAKTCVAAINGQTMGGRGWYRDDVWNAKYLRGFGWEDLMAGVRAEEREREERVKVGVRREKKEREEFLRGVERGKVEDTKRRKRNRKVDDAKKLDGSGKDGKERKEGERSGYERRFRQNEVKRKRDGEEQPEDVKRVLSKIF
ncbi:MAG: hypothetical protein LQ343_007800 [Gyalolechia ehrenbergii]|nr:MAG: hypothetical protein LQ343_007800 [Gyalolechia ehrenbergii]